MDFFSIGSACQTAHQIRRFTKSNQAYFYDWLTSPDTSYKSIFLDDEGHFLESNCHAVDKIEFSFKQNKIVNRGKVHVVDDYSGLYYQHEFKVIEGTSIVDESKISQHLPVAKSKFIYLKHKTINAIKNSEAPVLFRFQNVAQVNDAIALAKDIHNTYKILNPNVKVVIVSYLVDQEYAENDMIYVFPIKPGDTWKGNDDSWDYVFNKILNKVEVSKFYINRSFWEEDIYIHHSIDDFTKDICNGIHSLELSTLPLDILVKNSEEIVNNEYIAVSFSAAVTRKDRLSPFFSLSGIANKLSIPLIALADPTLSLSKNLTLGWYAGNKYYPNLPDLLANICDKLVESTGKKLLLIGGSGGGFAALNIQSRMLKKSSTKAIVWNPQTDLIAYSRAFVTSYMKVAFEDADHHVNNKNLEEFLNSRIKSVLKHDPESQKLILMDGYDFKHTRDLKVYLGDLKESFSLNNLLKIDNTLVCFGDWGAFGDGHLQPPADLLMNIISGVFQNKSFEYIDGLINKTNITSRKFLNLNVEKANVSDVRVFVNFFNDFMEIETNLSELFFGYDVSIRLVEKDTKKVIYIGPRHKSIIRYREFIKLENIKINSLNMSKYVVHLSLRDFYKNEQIISKPITSMNARKYEIGVL